MRVGFIGVGNIGNPMASQLLKAGHSLVVHDRRPAAAATLLAAGATWADTPLIVARQCEVVATCLPGPAEMAQVMLAARASAVLAAPAPHGSVYKLNGGSR
jgi:3-hydroxyisobutyrate dehydrogenase